jgi:hypothetical protein
MSSIIITLDRTLRNYGPEAQPLRELLRSNLAGSIARVWPGTTGHGGSVNRDDSSVLDEAGEAIRKLSPQNQVQTLLQAKAIEQAGELARARWLLFEQMQNPLPQVFLIVLGFWLIQLFIGLGLLAPLNSTSVIALVTCAVSMSAAIFLILEMNHPLDGIIQVSSAPLEAALAVISK